MYSWLERTELLLGEEKLNILKNANVLVVGVGGVGAYAAEMIARAGVGRMTIADADKEEALPLIRRFYDLGFNIEATAGTAQFLKANGIRTHVLSKLSEGSEELADSIRQGHIAYIINTSNIGATDQIHDGHEIRKLATENNVTLFTSLDTVKVLLDVLDEITLRISTIDA